MTPFFQPSKARLLLLAGVFLLAGCSHKAATSSTETDETKAANQTLASRYEAPVTSESSAESGALPSSRYTPWLLENGHRYVMKKKIPLFPGQQPPNLKHPVHNMVQIPIESEITVLDHQRIHGTHWYKVQSGVGLGWVNTTSLPREYFEEVGAPSTASESSTADKL